MYNKNWFYIFYFSLFFIDYTQGMDKPFDIPDLDSCSEKEQSIFEKDQSALIEKIMQAQKKDQEYVIQDADYPIIEKINEAINKQEKSDGIMQNYSSLKVRLDHNPSFIERVADLTLPLIPNFINFILPIVLIKQTNNIARWYITNNDWNSFIIKKIFIFTTTTIGTGAFFKIILLKLLGFIYMNNSYSIAMMNNIKDLSLGACEIDWFETMKLNAINTLPVMPESDILFYSMQIIRGLLHTYLHNDLLPITNRTFALSELREEKQKTFNYGPHLLGGVLAAGSIAAAIYCYLKK